MKKHLLLALLLLSTVFIACAHGRKTVKKKVKVQSHTASTSLRGLTSVTMRRSACFGRCPEYTLTISSNGMAEYNGTRNVTPLGVYEKNIGSDKAQALLKSFMDNRADTCRTMYISRIADMPGLSYTLTINGKQQLIGNAHFGPRYLVDLSDEMDALGKVDNTWKKIRDAPSGE